MHYAMADLHGETFRYQRILRQIHFTSRDILYILGDVVDRGGVDILQDILSRPNVVLLLGNHESMCLKAIDEPDNQRAVNHWRHNGGQATWEGLCRLPPVQRRRLLHFLRTLPDHLDVTVGSRRFYLVHGFPAGDTYTRMWARPGPEAVSPFPDGRIVVAGHTPVCELFGSEPADIQQYLDGLHGDHMRIFHGRGGYIDIDCACGYPVYPQRRLACLRLEDLAEFYA